MESFYEEVYPVRAFDIDFNNILKISSVLNYMQDSASAHAGKLNVGYNDIVNKNLFWVLYWVKVSVDFYPGFGDSVRIKTWPKTSYKLYSLRDFLLYNNENQLFAKATTAWVLLNISTKRPVELTSFADKIPFKPEENAIKELPEKIDFNTEVLDKKIFRRKINYSDIDVNRHVNNTRYVDFISDCFSKKFYDEYSLKNITISFMAESKYDDEIELELYERGKKVIYINSFNQENRKKVFQALLQWHKKDS